MRFASIFHKVNSLFELVNFASDILIILSFIILIILIIYGKRFGTNNVDKYYREELYKTIESNIENVFIIWDARSKEFSLVSSNFDKTFEIDRNIINDKYNTIINRFPEEIKRKIREVYWESYHKSSILEENFEYVKPVTKKKCWLMLRMYPVYSNKKLVRFICVITDITKEKNTQIELEEALLKIKQANQAKKEFLSHISHELKTPVNAIIGLATIASYRLNIHEINVWDYLNRIIMTSKNLIELIDNILDVSKLDRSKLVLVHKPFHLSRMINDFSFIIKEQITLKGQKFSLIINLNQEDYLIGDSLRLIQILTNCISNSMKFTQSGGEISLEVTEIEKLQDGYVLYRFVISDTGKGMREEYLKHLFEPYEQEDNTISENYGGTGIGMTITKELVDLMGGTIQVTSEVNKGTTVTIHLKFKMNYESDKQIPEEEIRNLTDYDCKGKRVLLVEDNEINRDIMNEILSSINLMVETANNGYDAVKLFKASPKGYFEAILMDVNMPELNGCQTADLIRTLPHPDASTIKIISLSADYMSDEEIIRNNSINYHIKKPIDIDYLYTLL